MEFLPSNIHHLLKSSRFWSCRQSGLSLLSRDDILVLGVLDLSRLEILGGIVDAVLFCLADLDGVYVDVAG